MFEKNDKVLFVVNSIVNIFYSLFIVVCVLTGISLCIIEVWALGLGILFLGSFFVGLMWMITRLFLLFFCDIKLIRNKIYNIKNDGLLAFIDDKELIKDEMELKDKNRIEVNDKLLQLKKLLDLGIITQEEFDREKNNLLNFKS